MFPVLSEFSWPLFLSINLPEASYWNPQMEEIVFTTSAKYCKFKPCDIIKGQSQEMFLYCVKFNVAFSNKLVNCVRYKTFVTSQANTVSLPRYLSRVSQHYSQIPFHTVLPRFYTFPKSGWSSKPSMIHEDANRGLNVLFRIQEVWKIH